MGLDSMIIKGISPSSYKAVDWCQNKFYISYGLGYREPSGKKAEIGNIVHDALECLGLSKINQDKKTFKHDELGEFSHPIDPDDVILKAYTHYAFLSHHDYNEKDLKECKRLMYKVLDCGMYDPRKLNVIETEKYFDFLIMEDWAKYEHGGETGYIGIRGIIDMITAPEDGVLHIVDWKTGQRKNWETGKAITIEDMNKDIQLLMYCYAASRLFPEIKTIIVTIFYVKDGGPFTLEPFNQEKKEFVENKLRERFHMITNIKEPKLLSYNRKHWKCTKLCGFNTMQFPGEDKCMCESVRDSIKENGMKITTDLFRKERNV